MEFVTIKTSDDQIFKVEKSIICASNLIKSILEDLDQTDEAVLLGILTKIPLPNITGPVMEIGKTVLVNNPLVLQYAEMHKNDTQEKTLEISPEDKELMNFPAKKMLFDVILAANYLDYANLLDLGLELSEC